MSNNAWNSQYPAQVAVGGTGDASFTAYSLIAAGTTSTGVLQSVGTGSSTNLLQSQGAGALPQWVDGSTYNSMVLIQSQSASSSASIAFTTGISSTYTSYVLLINNCVTSVNNANISLQWSTDGGSTYIATGYLSGQQAWAYNSATITNTNSTTAVLVTQATSNVAGTATSSVLNLQQISVSVYPEVNGMNMVPSGNFSLMTSTYTTAISVNAFKLLPSSGNITSGVFTLYGVART